jgi:glycosyltransferase involved in cell wall biosynthesis
VATTVDVIIPVLNEEHSLPRCVELLRSFFGEHPDRVWSILVADNGSIDKTIEVATSLMNDSGDLRITHIEQRGRGRALKKAWLESDADVRCYMDVDLSTDLKHVPELVSAIADEGNSLAIGSRLMGDSDVVNRTLKREITSRGYSALFRTMFFTKFKDAQCGFKAISADAANALVPLVKDNAWFFDTELLLIAQKNGYSIKEIPVRWVDDPDSRVKIISTAWEDIKGLLRLRFGGRPKVAGR